jgi:hypothetical protein
MPITAGLTPVSGPNDTLVPPDTAARNHSPTDRSHFDCDFDIVRDFKCLLYSCLKKKALFGYWYVKFGTLQLDR